jgi:hypothetical protein
MLQTVEVEINNGQIQPIEPTLLTYPSKNDCPHNIPTIAAFIAELEAIQAKSPVNFIPSDRTDRINSMLE